MQSIIRCLVASFFAMLVLSAPSIAYSQDDLEPFLEWERKQHISTHMKPLETELFGDEINPHMGTLSFNIVDISIPGNFDIPVEIRRTISQSRRYHADEKVEFGDWELAVPKISTIHFGKWKGNRCSKDFDDTHPDFRFGIASRTGSNPVFMSYEANDFSKGLILEVNGRSQQIVDKRKAKRNGGRQFPSHTNWVTTSNWYFTCITAKDGTQGFLGHAPNGEKYYFDEVIERMSRRQFPDNGNREFDVHETILAASRVIDPYANTVQYKYVSGRLTRIHASDGRAIDINYGERSAIAGGTFTEFSQYNKVITSVEANGRKFSYLYDTNNFTFEDWEEDTTQITYPTLSKVTLPDGNSWIYEFDNMVAIAAPSAKCKRGDKVYTLFAKHPAGAKLNVKFKEIYHRHGPDKKLNRPENCFTMRQHADKIFAETYITNDRVTYISTMSVIEKKISSASLPDQLWVFKYEEDKSDSDQSLTNQTNYTIIDAPDRTYRYEHYWPRVSSNSPYPGGKIARTLTYELNSTILLEKIEYSWIKELPFGYTFVDLLRGKKEYDSEINSSAFLNSKTKTTRYYASEQDIFSMDYEYNNIQTSLDYSFGKPIKKKVYSNISTTPRTTEITHKQDRSKWILGLPKTVTQNGRLLTTNSYNPNTGQLETVKQYGASYNTREFDYNSDGTVNWVKDALGRQTMAQNWKRGKPQKVIYPNGIAFAQLVDNNGWVTSYTDPKVQTTIYQHDNMGRLTQIDPPGSDYVNTDIAYSFPSSGGAIQTITKGQSETTVTYDSLFRPVLEKTQALDTGWSSYVNTAYNALGQVTFKSQPSTNPYEIRGTDYTYDSLGRIYQERENVAPYARTRHRYYSSHRHRIFDPSGAWTDYYSYGYDGPDNTDYRAIYRYTNGGEYQRTFLFKDVWGQLGALRQWGNTGGYNVNKTQHFYYDNQQRLCRHYVPEHGATKYQYNDAGEMTAYAKGQANNNGYCGSALPNISAKVSQSYDALGRPTLTNFADPATADIARTYDANGNVTAVNRGGINWIYAYNDIDLLTQENLYIDGRQYNSVYNYNTAAHLIRKRLPSGRNIFYTPDGLGRSKTIKNGGATLASNTSFHPSGALAGMTYGNGQSFTQTLNARLLPERTRSALDGAVAFDQQLTYDARGKVTSIIDRAMSGNNRAYGYDGLGRLTSASGPWGPNGAQATGSFKYDSLDNLRQKKLGSRTVNLTYDSRNRLRRSADTGASRNRTVAYDPQGNVTTLGSLAFIYDYSDQPVVVSGTANGVGAANGAYTYDGNLKRVKSVVNGKTIYNVYDASGSLVHIDAVTDNKKTDYVSGPMGTLVRISNNVVTYLHPDHLGSAQSGTNSAGAVSWREQYTPFGEELQSPAANDNLAGFTGHIKDKATGLNYMQARYYDPVIGRFLSVDPVTFLETGNPNFFNRYAYGFNDPINLIDPSGENPCNAIDCEGLKQAATNVAESIGRGINAATQDPQSFEQGVGKGVQNGIANTVNGAVTLGEAASSNLTVGQLPDVPNAAPASNQAEQFGMVAGEGAVVAGTALVAPQTALGRGGATVATRGFAASVKASPVKLVPGASPVLRTSPIQGTPTTLATGHTSFEQAAAAQANRQTFGSALIDALKFIAGPGG